VLQTVSATDVADEQIAEAVAALRGEIAQVPSAVSAVKVGGQRAYKLVREGQTVELAPRSVRIDRFDVLDIRRHDGLIDVDVDVDCSSGTYIRALARDVGATLNVGGHLTALRRTRVGRFGLDQARTLETLAEQPRLSYSLDEACLQSFPRRDLSANEAEDTRHGRPLRPAGIDAVYAATAPDGHVIALLKDEPTRTSSVVVLRPATL
jgi:tRNA pseudouridine55 synthase